MFLVRVFIMIRRGKLIDAPAKQTNQSVRYIAHSFNMKPRCVIDNLSVYSQIKHAIQSESKMPLFM